VNSVPVQYPGNDDDRIHLRRPVTAQGLAPLLGMKSHHVLAELMGHNMFCNRTETLPDSVAQSLAREYHHILVIND
jgi:hypothetical protein